MLAPAGRPFNRPGWIFELKYDGFRVLAGRKGQEARLISRRGTDLLPCYPEIGACLLELPEMLMDGELVVLDAHGRSDFETLRRRLALRRSTSVEYAAKRTPAAIFAFDLLELRGKDLRGAGASKAQGAIEGGVARLGARPVPGPRRRGAATGYSRSPRSLDKRGSSPSMAVLRIGEGAVADG